MYTQAVGEAVAVVVVDVVAPVFEPAPVVVAVSAARLADLVVVVPGTLVMAIVLVAPLTSLITRIHVLDPHAPVVLACVEINHVGRPDKPLKFSSSVNSKSIRLIFGRIDCSCRVLEAQQKASRRNGRIRPH